MRHSSSLLALVALAACNVRPTPAPAPQTTLVATKGVTSEGSVPAPSPLRPRSVPAPSRTDDVVPAGAPVAVANPVAAPAISNQDVTRQTIAVFGDSAIGATATADSADADEPSWDMDVRSYETQDRVAHYVSMFSGKAKEHIASRLEHGTRYEAMIRSKFKAGGLPEDMYYLALVESGFDPNAYSRAAAVGMWQFMTSTGRGLGMRIDWWVDERRDPVRSTVAAVRFIRGLRDQFGSLYLAAAAYNGGPGRVARGLAKYSDDLENTQQAEDAFFVLAEKDYLRNETREYVPQLIAAALVAKEPIRYGMELHPLPPFAYDSVKVPGATPLAAVAKASGATVAAIRELNPQFLRGMTPPGDRMQVRVPVGAATSFDASFSGLSKDERTATHVIVSKKGQTVDGLADGHGVSAWAIESFNPNLRHLKPSGKLVTGQSIVLPTTAVASAALHVPDPSIEKYGSSSTARLKTHTVRRGETVRSIARKYDTSPERLMRLNGLRKPVIFAGQDLIVSGKPAKGARSSRGVKSSKGVKASRGVKTSKGVKASRGVKASKSVHSSASVSGDRKGVSGVKTGGPKKQSGASSKAGARKSASKKSSVA